MNKILKFLLWLLPLFVPIVWLLGYLFIFIFTGGPSSVSENQIAAAMLFIGIYVALTAVVLEAYEHFQRR